jgi:hypothetical protein
MVDNQRVDWVRDREFKRDGMVLTVWKLPLRRPQFRFDIGAEGYDNRTFRSFNVKFEGKGKVTMKCSFNLEALKALEFEAKEYMLGVAQEAEDDHIESMVRREDRGKPKVQAQMGLKSLVKRDAAAKVQKAEDDALKSGNFDKLP